MIIPRILVTITAPALAALAITAMARYGAATSTKEVSTMFHELDSPARERLFTSPIATLDGKPSSLSAHRGKALLLVNVASKCGLTPQYTGLEKLQDEYGPRGFTVLGFPCNQFGGQEPGTATEIQTFCSTKYGVSFPLFEKIEVNGGGRHPIYNTLTAVADGDGQTGDVQWNFEKFVVSADGTKVARFRPRTDPSDASLIAAIEAALPH